MKKFIITILFSSLFVSCGEDFLNINPSDQYSVETFWKTEEHAMAAMTGCYTTLRSLAFWSTEMDILTPNAVAYNESLGTRTISEGSHTPTTELIVQRWRICYEGIGRTNTVLGKIDQVETRDEFKKRLIAEAKFLRAFYYHSLVEVFGGVPLILEVPDADKHANLPRDSKEEVLSAILKDLNDAIQILPLEITEDEIGRATKGAALALKGRVLLYNEQWPEAASAAKELMDLNNYSLFSNYRELFMLENEGNPEVIWDIQFKNPQFTHGLDHVSTLLGRPAMLKEFVESYLMKDGEPSSESELYDPEKPYENRDPRLYQTVRLIGSMYNGKITTPEDVAETGFGLKKYTTYPDSTSISHVGQGRSEINMIVFRYAEVLLTYAEAQNEATGPDPSVYDAINEIRSRESVAMPELEPGLTKEEMREAIRHERRIELALEGLYYSDIRRWRIAHIVNNGPVYDYEGSIYQYKAFDENRDYLWPIPYVQIQENPNLEQNPNWF